MGYGHRLCARFTARIRLMPLGYFACAQYAQPRAYFACAQYAQPRAYFACAQYGAFVGTGYVLVSLRAYAWCGTGYVLVSLRAYA